MCVKFKSKWTYGVKQRHLAICFSVGLVIYFLYLVDFNVQNTRRPIEDIESDQQNEIIRQHFVAKNLSFLNGTLKLFGHYEKGHDVEDIVQKQEQTILLEIQKVHSLVLELLKTNRIQDAEGRESKIDGIPTRTKSMHILEKVSTYAKTTKEIYNGPYTPLINEKVSTDTKTTNEIVNGSDPPRVPEKVGTYTETTKGIINGSDPPHVPEKVGTNDKTTANIHYGSEPSLTHAKVTAYTKTTEEIVNGSESPLLREKVSSYTKTTKIIDKGSNHSFVPDKVTTYTKTTKQIDTLSDPSLIPQMDSADAKTTKIIDKGSGLLIPEKDFTDTQTSRIIDNGSDTLYITNSKAPTTLDTESFRIYNQYFKEPRNVQEVSCKKLFENDGKEQVRADELAHKPFPNISPSVFINITKDCENYRNTKGYILDSLTTEEKEFPLAYSILMFKEVAQFEKLLRAIYRPQNYYCIHVDKKSPEELFSAVTGIADCFENVFFSSSRVDVQWGKFSVIEPELICMKDLLKYKWKYFINLTGQEFPLRTNKELVEILKIYNGANDLEGTQRRADKNRWKDAGEAPHGIRPVKGSVHITVNRDFIDYVVNNQTAKDFINWTKQVDFPDETLFSSLNHNPHLGIRGSYKGEPETDRRIKPFLTRFKNWGMQVFNWPCHGHRVRLICIFGTGDLPMLYRRPELFANKFYYFYQSNTLKCMEELHFNRTRDEYLEKIQFNTTFYKNLEFIKNVV